MTRGLSSVGRAPPLQGGCQGFDSPRLHFFGHLTVLTRTLPGYRLVRCRSPQCNSSNTTTSLIAVAEYSHSPVNGDTSKFQDFTCGRSRNGVCGRIDEPRRSFLVKPVHGCGRALPRHRARLFQRRVRHTTDTCSRRASPERVHASWPRHDVGYALAEVIARQIEANPAKGPPLTFPGHVHQLLYPTTPAVTWFDVVRTAGWNDQPNAGRSNAPSPQGAAPIA
jgi:hypothetical protein